MIFNKIFFLILFLFLSVTIIAQKKEHNSERLFSNFHYNYIYYEANVKGFEEFLENTEFDDQELKKELTDQVKSMKSRKLLGDVVTYSTFTISATILLASTSDVQKFNNVKLPAFALFSGGLITGLILKPGSKDYYKFINTFNMKNKSTPLRISYKIVYENSLQTGIVLNF